MASELSPNHNTLLHVFCATNMRFSNTVLDSCNVGYYGASKAESGYYLVTPMFEKTGGGPIMMKDIVPTTTDPSGVKGGDFQIALIDNDRNPAGTYQWKPYSSRFGVTTLAGWYDFTTDRLATNETDVIDFTMGVMLYSKKQVTLTFAGQVMTAEPHFDISAAGYYRCGNIMPIDVSITNIVPVATEIKGGDFQISTYDKDRGPLRTWQWKPYSSRFGVTTLAGWYDFNTDKLETEKIFTPGEGFVLYTKKAVSITFPSIDAK